MGERSELDIGGAMVPTIPYDAFAATDLFLDTGRTPDEMLPLFDLAPAEWTRLRDAYKWFPSRHECITKRGQPRPRAVQQAEHEPRGVPLAA